jgi:hypothetical protein
LTMPSADPDARSVEVGSMVETRTGAGWERGVWRMRERVGGAASVEEEEEGVREIKSEEEGEGA